MKSKLKRLFAKARWYILLFAVGLAIYIAVPFLSSSDYQTADSSPTSVTPQHIISASANQSGKVAIIDSSVTPPIIALSDTKNSEPQYIVNAKQLELFNTGDFTAYSVAVDDDDNMFIHCLYWIKNEGTIKKEEIVRIASDGRYDLMLRKELISMTSDNLTNVKFGPHRLGGKMVSIRRTCFIGSMSAT